MPAITTVTEITAFAFFFDYIKPIIEKKGLMPFTSSTFLITTFSLTEYNMDHRRII